MLWLFGFFAGCSQSGGSNSSSYQINLDSTNQLNINKMPPEVQRWILNVDQFIKNNPGKFFTYVVSFVILALIITLFFAALKIYGKIGIISGVLSVEKGGTEISFDTINPEVKKFFWKIVFLYLLIALANLALAVLAFVSIFTIILAIPMICVSAFLMIILSILTNQIIIALIAEDLDPLDALKKAWSVVFSNIPLYLTVAIINTIIFAVIGLILAVPIIGFISTLFIWEKITLTSIMLIAAGILILLSVLISPVLAFKETTWVLTYNQAAKLNFDETSEEEFTELKIDEPAA